MQLRVHEIGIKQDKEFYTLENMFSELDAKFSKSL